MFPSNSHTTFASVCLGLAIGSRYGPAQCMDNASH